ncbi:hypothetical protein [Azohydromonas aeria]|nr:hypothetical protein [Azohydromonas aeria]
MTYSQTALHAFEIKPQAHAILLFMQYAFATLIATDSSQFSTKSD